MSPSEAAFQGLLVGGTAAGASRAAGGCYAACAAGTTCNSSTGLCEALPCRGQCGVNGCDASGRCVEGSPAPAMSTSSNAIDPNAPKRWPPPNTPITP